MLADRARILFGADWPDSPETITAKGCRVVGLGPGNWLVIARTDENGSMADAIQSLKDVAAVCEQSGGYVVYEMAGDGAAELMQRGVFVDLDPSAFPVGRAATTALSHVGVTLWRTAPDAFEIAVFRSYRTAFEHWRQSTVAF